MRASKEAWERLARGAGGEFCASPGINLLSCARAGSAGPTDSSATGLGGSRGEGLPSSR